MRQQYQRPFHDQIGLVYVLRVFNVKYVIMPNNPSLHTGVSVNIVQVCANKEVIFAKPSDQLNRDYSPSFIAHVSVRKVGANG